MKNTTQIPRQGTLLYRVTTMDGETDASGIPILNIELKKFPYDLENMEDTYTRFIEAENEVREKFPSSLLHESYLEKIWVTHNSNPILISVIESIRDWRSNQISKEKS